MGLFSTEINSLEDLFVHELRDLYDAEHRILDALPKMADAAHEPKLKRGFTEHREQTLGQVKRLEQIFSELDIDAKRHTCDAMKGLIDEGESLMNADAPAEVKDAALISAAQRVEHYEIAGYGTLRTFARRLGHNHAAELLQQTLDEEGETDKRLTHLATSYVNPRAA